MSRIASDKTVRIDLENGEWIDIRASISFKDLMSITESCDLKDEKSLERAAVPLLCGSIVGWRILGDDGQEVVFSNEMVEKLDVETVQMLLPRITDQYFPEKKN